jgi:hypothetical protein
MVRVIEPTEYKAAARSLRAPHAGSPPIVIPTRPSLASRSKPSRPRPRVVAAKATSLWRLLRAPACTCAVDRGEETGARKSNKETMKKDKCVLLTALTN